MIWEKRIYVSPLFLFLGNVTVVTQRYNRLIEMTGYGGRSEFRLTRHHLGEYQSDGSLAGGGFGEWYLYEHDPDDRDVDSTVVTPTVASALPLEDIGIFMDTRLSTIDFFPDLVTIRRARPGVRLLILGPTDEQFVQYQTRGIVYGADGATINLLIELDEGERHGADFALTGDVALGISGFGGEELQDKVTKRVWAQLSERGAGSGILVSGGGVEAEGQQEDLDIGIRYDPKLLYGINLVDDLGRAWTVYSSLTVEDRRGLRFEASRLVVSNEPLPRILERP